MTLEEYVIQLRSSGKSTSQIITLLKRLETEKESELKKSFNQDEKGELGDIRAKIQSLEKE